ncbi:MAG: carbohydrate ABC transporter permease [Clostridia bacterium]|nr:carbohydrate ABC transporter permease [Clostridia bacterium]
MSELTQIQVDEIKRRAKNVKIKKYVFKYVVSAVRWLFILGMCFVILYPLFSQLSLSFMTSDDMYDATVKYIPKQIIFGNYQTAWMKLGGFQTFSNTFLLTFSTSILQVATATLVGYGLARFRFKGGKILFFLVILALLLPPDLLFTHRYSMFRSLDQINDSPLSMLCFAATCTGLKCSLYIFLMRQFFRGMPKELEEAAYVDGAGPAKTFVSIMLPGAVSMMVTVFLFSFVWQWLDSSYTTVFMREVNLISTKIGSLDSTVGTGITSSVDLNISLIKNAAIMMIIAPLIVLYVFTQRFFVESISRSGLVG